MLDYAVLYCSETGNTRQLAFEIFRSLPGHNKDIGSLSEIREIPEARTYFVGFFVNKGTCSVEVIRCLEHLGEKNIALFATCGASPSPEYEKTVEDRVRVWIESDNVYHGMFLCQGKMPIQVRQKYESMRSGENESEIRRLLANFDQAMLHPSEEDVSAAKEFARSVASLVG